MNRALLNRVESRQRFVQEGRVAAAIRHPNVISVFEVGSWKAFLYIVLELLSGVAPDRDIKQNGALSRAEVTVVTLPIVSGLAAVHEQGLVHRDIKPSNIFLANTLDGLLEPKLLNFWISRLHAGRISARGGPTGSREIFGAPAYLPPEALNGTKGLGPLSDQYSLGVVLYG